MDKRIILFVATICVDENATIINGRLIVLWSLSWTNTTVCDRIQGIRDSVKSIPTFSITTKRDLTEFRKTPSITLGAILNGRHSSIRFAEYCYYHLLRRQTPSLIILPLSCQIWRWEELVRSSARAHDENQNCERLLWWKHWKSWVS